MKAHCLLPSSRVMTVRSPMGLASAVAMAGGHALAHWSTQTLLPAESLSKVYNVMPALLTRMPSWVLTAWAWAPAENRAAQANARAAAVCLRMVCLVGGKVGDCPLRTLAGAALFPRRRKKTQRISRPAGQRRVRNAFHAPARSP
ncbi:hypothetical protein D3C72_1821040 [compost metagenome]